jgi:hypothetical protein
MKKLLLILVLISPAVYVGAQHQNALDFDGVDDAVYVPGASSLIAGSNQLSLACWVFPTNAAPMYPDFDGFAGFRNEIDCDFYIMQISPSQVIEARMRNSAGSFFTIAYNGLTLNIWQHLTLTYDGVMLRLYIGGVAADSVAASGGITNQGVPFNIGTLPFSNNPYWLTGMLDEIGLWSRALTPAEIACISQQSIDENDPDCKLFFSCNQGIAGGVNTSIGLLDDHSGHGVGLLNSFALTGSTSNFVPGVANATPVGHTMCQGDVYQFGDQVLSAAGYYYETFPVSGACGGLQELNLQVITVDTSVSLAGTTLTANFPGAFSYQWVDCNNGYAAIAGADSQSFSPVSNGAYALIISDSGCVDTSSCYTVTNVSVQEGILANSIYISPNPFADQLTIRLGRKSDRPAEVRVVNSFGEVIFHSTLINYFPLVIETAPWSSGIYFIEAFSGNGVAHYKLVKPGAATMQ